MKCSLVTPWGEGGREGGREGEKGGVSLAALREGGREESSFLYGF